MCFLFGHNACNIIITIVAYTFLKLKQDTFFMKQKGVAECFRKSGREAKVVKEYCDYSANSI